MSFVASAGTTYAIATYDLGVYCDTVLRLYDADGDTVLAENDDDGPGPASRIEWTSPQTAIYYVRVHEYLGRAGPDSEYTIRVSTLEEPTPTTLTGQVLLQGRSSYEGIQVTAHPFDDPLAVVTATTTASGTVTLATTTPCTVTAQYPSYLAERWVIAGMAPTRASGAELDLDPISFRLNNLINHLV